MEALQKTEQFGTRQCVKFRDKIFTKHYALRGELARGFLRYAVSESSKNHEAIVEKNANGNRWLMAMDKKLSLDGIGARSAVLDDDEICSIAKAAAANCKRAIDFALMQSFEVAVKIAKKRVERHGIEWDDYVRCTDEEERERRRREKQWALMVRAGDEIWWRRQLRKIYRRRVESVLREAGCVVKKRAPYISDWGVAQWKQSQVANREILGGLFAESDEGDQLSLLECSDASVANPVNRRNELMTRVRGMEELAIALDLSGMLLTLTAPSKYHAYHINGSENKKFNQSTPRETMEYLNKVWSLIRSAWAKEDIKALGLRVCEPHHDGTPHFHFLLFIREEQREKAWEIFSKYALLVDGNEPGAAEHRCDYVLIDAGKGTAAGYVAKYIAKNIDGFGFKEGEADEEAKVPAVEGALRARAWASLWGIRQFQAIGSVSVTVYRELRRIQESFALEPEEVQACIAAADAGDWAAFTAAMGGAWIKREEQLLRPAYKELEKLGKYGEEVKRLIGVALRRVLAGYKIEFLLNYQLITREKTWEIKPAWEVILSRNSKVKNFVKPGNVSELMNRRVA